MTNGAYLNGTLKSYLKNLHVFVAINSSMLHALFRGKGEVTVTLKATVLAKGEVPLSVPSLWLAGGS